MKTVAELTEEETAALIWRVTLGFPVEYKWADTKEWHVWPNYGDILPWLRRNPSGENYDVVYLRVKAK